MTTLVFPEQPSDLGDAFNNALSRGEFVNDPSRHNFWGHHELLASETEDGEALADWFYQKHTLEFRRVKREETES